MFNSIKIHFVTLLTCLIGISCAYTQDNEEFEWIFKNSKSLSEVWELDNEHKRGTFLITSYKPIYFTLAKYTSNTNKFPVRENSSMFLDERIELNTVESKFQISLKTKVFQNAFWGMGDVWAAYSQRAFWQIYNKKISRPFRETNYEPEVLVNFPLNSRVLGFQLRMAGVALVHESNGRSDPISRSWNRIIFHAGFERENWQVIVRPWIRLGSKIDDNEDISDYVGRGEAKVIYDWNRQRFTAIGRHSMRFGDNSRGSIQLNWSFPILGNFSGQIQFFDGYGETLIDYNHRQTTIGIGVSLIN